MKRLLLLPLLTFATAALAQPCTAILNATSNGPVCPGTTLSLNNNIAGAVYQWTGPNSFTSALPNPQIMSVTPAAAGSYYLTVTLGPCVYLDTVVVATKTQPAAPVINISSPTCDGDSLGVGSTTPGTTTFYLVNPSNGVSSTTGYMKVKIMIGEYKAYAISSNACVSDTTKDTVTALPGHPAKPNVSLSKPACNGDALSFAASGAGGVSSFKFWNPSGQLITNPSPNASYANSGVYKCVAYNTAGCPSDTTTLSVIIHGVIMPNVAIYGNEEPGPFASVKYTSYVTNAGPNPVYMWMRNGIAITNATLPTYTAINGVDVKPGDLISLSITGDTTPCPGTGVSNQLSVMTNLGVSGSHVETMALYPNPNNGSFVIADVIMGSKITIVNSLGQVVYTKEINALVDAVCNVNLAPGIYMVKQSTDSKSFVQKMIIQ